MAINTYRLWMATDANRLLANQFSFIQAATPAFYQGNVAELELHIVASAGVGTTPVEVPFPAGAEITVAVGNTNSYPTGGSWELSVDGVETSPMPWNATTAQVEDALNALTSVSAAGGVAVSKTGEGYTITWNTYGLKPDIGIGSDTLTPASYESISLVQSGNAERRQVVFVELRQNPIALSSEWTPLAQPSITVTEVQAWNGTNRIWRVSVSPQPKAGTMTLSYGSKTATVVYNASASSIASALSPAQVFSTGQYQWDIALDEDSVLTAIGSLIGYNGYQGNITFATSECHQFLAGAELRQTTLEVSISVDDKRYTLIQTPCNVYADVVSDGVIQPIPLGVALSEQVANVRYVRRDVDQNPDASTQDIIWDNLGVSNVTGSNVASAISESNAPTAANPFATIADLSGLDASWGNITGTLSNQTDLQTALDGKYSTSNPAGYLNTSTADLIYQKQSSMFAYAQTTSPTFTGNISLINPGPDGFGNKITVKVDNLSPVAPDYQTMIGPTSIQVGWSGGDSYGYLTSGSLIVGSDAAGNISCHASMTGGYNPFIDIVENGPSAPIASRTTRIQEGKFMVNNQDGLGFIEPYTSASQLSNYALLSGAIFTGGVNSPAFSSQRYFGIPANGVAAFNIGIGGTSTDSTTPGDIWISTGGASLNFRDATGAWRQLISTSSASQIVTTSTNPVLRIEQRGTGRSFVVEDQNTPDADCFIIDNSGNVGVGVSNSPTTPWVATHKVEVNGAVKTNTITFDGTAQFKVNSVASHSGGSNSHDLFISYNGSTYRIPMIFVSTP
jgi:hypothetical protein